MPFFAGIGLRSGYLGEARYGLLNLVYDEGGATMVQHYARLADAPGFIAPEPLAAPQLRWDAAQVAATQAKFGLAGPYAVLCPGAEYGPAKRWPHFAGLAARLEVRVVLLGSAKDAAAAAGVPGTNLVGQTTLDEAIDLIAGATQSGASTSISRSGSFSRRRASSGCAIRASPIQLGATTRSLANVQ